MYPEDVQDAGFDIIRFDASQFATSKAFVDAAALLLRWYPRRPDADGRAVLRAQADLPGI